MGAYAVSVEYETPFRGFSERTGNVFHYRITAAVESDYRKLAEGVVARLRLALPDSAAFKQVRVWGPVDGPQADNKMRYEALLTGNGTRTAVASNTYPELCYVVSMFVGRSPVKNRKVFVRKYLRVLKPLSTLSDIQNPTISQSDRNFFSSWFEGCKVVTHEAVSFTMCTPKDVQVPADAVAKTLPELRIRQMKQ